MSTNQQDLDAIVGQKYQHGFVTDIESDTVPPGPRRGRHPAHLGARRASRQFLLDWRLKAYRHWLTMREPRLGARCDYRADRLPGDLLLLGAEGACGRARRASTRSIPKLLATYEKLGMPLHERARLAGVAVDAVFDSVSVATTFKDKLAEAGIIFCSVLRGGARITRSWCEQYLGTVVPYTRQLLRRAQLGGVHRRLVRLHARRACAARWSCPPISASTPRTPASSSAR